MPGARSALIEHTSESPDIGTLVQRLATRLFGAHVRHGAEDDAFPCGPQFGWVLHCGAILSVERRHFRQPEVEYLIAPAGVIFMFAGLRSRWMMPCWWASSSAWAI